MAMISATITLAFIFIFAVSQATSSYWNEYCVADVQARNETLRDALDWACSNGADCNVTLPGHPCFEPNTTLHHASYAFNSYYQKFKHIPTASCYFNTAAVVTATDPSFGLCIFHLTS